MPMFDDERIDKIYETGKDCVKMASGFGIGIMFGAFTQTYMPVVGLPVKAAVWLGTKIFTGLVTDRTDKYIDEVCDETIETIKGAIGMTEDNNGDRET